MSGSVSYNPRFSTHMTRGGSRLAKTTAMPTRPLHKKISESESKSPSELSVASPSHRPKIEAISVPMITLSDFENKIQTAVSHLPQVERGRIVSSEIAEALPQAISDIESQYPALEGLHVSQFHRAMHDSKTSPGVVHREDFYRVDCDGRSIVSQKQITPEGLSNLWFSGFNQNAQIIAPDLARAIWNVLHGLNILDSFSVVDSSTLVRNSETGEYQFTPLIKEKLKSFLEVIKANFDQVVAKFDQEHPEMAGQLENILDEAEIQRILAHTESYICENVSSADPEVMDTGSSRSMEDQIADHLATTLSDGGIRVAHALLPDKREIWVWKSESGRVYKSWKQELIYQAIVCEEAIEMIEEKDGQFGVSLPGLPKKVFTSKEDAIEFTKNYFLNEGHTVPGATWEEGHGRERRFCAISALGETRHFKTSNARKKWLSEEFLPCGTYRLTKDNTVIYRAEDGQMHSFKTPEDLDTYLRQQDQLPAQPDTTSSSLGWRIFKGACKSLFYGTVAKVILDGMLQPAYASAVPASPVGGSVASAHTPATTETFMRIVNGTTPGTTESIPLQISGSVLTVDGGTVFWGTAGSDPFIMKTSSSGDITWTNRFSTNITISGLAQIMGSDLVIIGSDSGIQKAVVMRIDPGNGGILSQKAIVFPEAEQTSGSVVVETPNGFNMTGTIVLPSGDTQIYTVSMSMLASLSGPATFIGRPGVQYESVVSQQGSMIVGSCNQTGQQSACIITNTSEVHVTEPGCQLHPCGGSGNGLLAGTRTVEAGGVSNAFFATLGSDGTPSQFKSIGEPGISYQTHAYYQLPDGSAILAGSRGKEAFVVQVNATGTPVWTKSFKYSDSQNDCHFTGVTQRADGSIILTGDRRGTKPAAIEFQIDPHGELGTNCTQSTEWEISAPAVTVNPFTPTITREARVESQGNLSAISNRKPPMDVPGLDTVQTCDVPPEPPIPGSTPTPTPVSTATPSIPIETVIKLAASIGGSVLVTAVGGSIVLCVCLKRRARKQMEQARQEMALGSIQPELRNKLLEQSPQDQQIIAELARLGIKVYSDEDDLPFELERQLGRGASGIVFLAKTKDTQEEIAVKVASLDGPNPLRLEELLVMAKVRTAPNLLQIRGFHINPQTRKVAIMMECMRNGGVDSYFRAMREARRPIAWTARVAMMRDILRGLVYLHTQDPPILHRDLKAANLLVDQHGVVKISDFGLSKERSQATQTMAGTPAYTAPEILRGDPHYTENVDIYSLGMVLWELISEHPPFSDTPISPVMLMTQILQGTRPSIPTFEAVGAGIPGLRTVGRPGTELTPDQVAESQRIKTSYDMVVDLIRQCWREDPAERPSAVQLLQAFESIIREQLGQEPGVSVSELMGGITTPQQAENEQKRKEAAAATVALQRRRKPGTPPAPQGTRLVQPPALLSSKPSVPPPGPTPRPLPGAGEQPTQVGGGGGVSGKPVRMSPNPLSVRTKPSAVGPSH